MSLNILRDRAHETAVAKGFKDASIPEDVALMHSELSELLEDYRAGYLPENHRYEGTDADSGARLGMIYLQPADENGKLRKPVGIPSELADVLIRAFHFAGKHGIDLDRAVREKMAYNETRSHLHGGKKI